MQIVERTANYFGHCASDVNAILKRRGGVLPLNANTMTSAAPPDYLQQSGSLTAFEHAFAPLKSCLQVWDPAPYSPRSKNILKYVAAGSATLVDPPNFQVGGSAIGAIECSVSHYSQPWPLSNTDLHSGIRQRDLFFANAQTFAATLMIKVTTLLTAANYPQTPVTALAASFGLPDAADAYGRIAGPAKSLLLDSPYFASLSHGSARGFQSGEAAYGWQGIHEQSSGWASAGPKVRGVALAQTAVVLVTGFLEEIRANTIERTLIGLPGLDLAIEFNKWFAQGTRTAWCSLDCILGAAKGDGNAAVLIQEP